MRCEAQAHSRTVLRPHTAPERGTGHCPISSGPQHSTRERQDPAAGTETKTVRAVVLESESMSDTMLAAKGKVEKLVKRESQKRER